MRRRNTGPSLERGLRCLVQSGAAEPGFFLPCCGGGCCQRSGRFWFCCRLCDLELVCGVFFAIRASGDGRRKHSCRSCPDSRIAGLAAGKSCSAARGFCPGCPAAAGAAGHVRHSGRRRSFRGEGRRPSRFRSALPCICPDRLQPRPLLQPAGGHGASAAPAQTLSAAYCGGKLPAFSALPLTGAARVGLARCFVDGAIAGDGLHGLAAAAPRISGAFSGQSAFCLCPVERVHLHHAFLRRLPTCRLSPRRGHPVCRLWGSHFAFQPAVRHICPVRHPCQLFPRHHGQFSFCPAGCCHCAFQLGLRFPAGPDGLLGVFPARATASCMAPADNFSVPSGRRNAAGSGQHARGKPFAAKSPESGRV